MEPPVAHSDCAERSAGGKGAAYAAAQRTLAAEHRSASEADDGRRNGNQMLGIPVVSL